MESSPRKFVSLWRFTDDLLRALEESGKTLGEIRQIILPMSNKESTQPIKVNGKMFYNHSEIPCGKAIMRQRVQELVNASALQRIQHIQKCEAHRLEFEKIKAEKMRLHDLKLNVFSQHDYTLSAARKYGVRSATIKANADKFGPTAGAVSSKNLKRSRQTRESGTADIEPDSSEDLDDEIASRTSIVGRQYVQSEPRPIKKRKQEDSAHTFNPTDVEIPTTNPSEISLENSGRPELSTASSMPIGSDLSQKSPKRMETTTQPSASSAAISPALNRPSSSIVPLTPALYELKYRQTYRSPHESILLLDESTPISQVTSQSLIRVADPATVRHLKTSLESSSGNVDNSTNIYPRAQFSKISAIKDKISEKKKVFKAEEVEEDDGERCEEWDAANGACTYIKKETASPSSISKLGPLQAHERREEWERVFSSRPESTTGAKVKKERTEGKATERVNTISYDESSVE